MFLQIKSFDPPLKVSFILSASLLNKLYLVEAANISLLAINFLNYGAEMVPQSGPFIHTALVSISPCIFAIQFPSFLFFMNGILFLFNTAAKQYKLSTLVAIFNSLSNSLYY